MRLPFRSRQRRVSGFDLGTHSLKIAIIAHRGGERRISQLLQLPLDEGLITEGLIYDTAAVTERLRRTESLLDMKQLSVVTAARCGREAMVKFVDLERQSREAARAALATDRSLSFHIPVGEGVYDLVITDPEGEGPIMKAVAVGANRGLIQTRQQAFLDAGLPLAGIDLDAFAMVSLFQATHAENAEQGRYVLLNIGYETCTAVILQEGIVRTARQTSTGTANLITSLGMLPDDAEMLLRSEDLPALHPRQTEEWYGNIAGDILQTIEYIEDKDGDVGTVYLMGGGALVAGTQPALARSLGAPVQILDPLQSIPCDGELPLGKDATGPLFALAIGLALRDDV